MKTDIKVFDFYYYFIIINSKYNKIIFGLNTLDFIKI